MSEEKQEIIIVRRGGDDHDGHHGGAWKIAFADFMTAMMALFLVLWLVNAANEETKKAVASYFNPVKLVDRNKSTRGLNDPGGSSQPDSSGENQPTDPSDPSDESAGAGAITGPTQAFTDTEFFADPMTVLEILANQGLAEEALEEALAEQLAGEALTDAETAIEFVDPFAPDNWTAPDNTETAVFDDPGDRQSEAPLMDDTLETAEAAVSQTIDRIETTALPAQDDPTDPMVVPEADLMDGQLASENGALAPGEAMEPMAPGEAMDPGEAMNPGEAMEANADPQPDSETEGLIADLSEALIEAGVPEAALSFQTQADRVAVSLADADGFEMFGIGSAVPSPNAVRAIEALAAAINQAGMQIAVEGHTDARPFQSGGSDNWKLSSDRALAAFYMLRRSGIDEAKFSTLEGRADRELAVPDNPLDSRNRRIEIFLEPTS